MNDYDLLASVNWQFLSADGRVWLDDVIAKRPPSSVVKDYPKRKVARNSGVYYKIVRYQGVASLWKTLYKGNACKEGELTRRMAAMGLAVPEVLGYGTITKSGLLAYDVVLTREIANARSLREFLAEDWPALQPVRKHGLVKEFGRFVRALHDVGVVHADPHPGNVLFAPDAPSHRFVILDTDRVRIHAKPLSEAARLRNLALFPSFVSPPSRNEWFRFLVGYGIRPSAAGLPFVEKLQAELFRHASKLYRKHAKRAMTSNRRFCKESVAGFTVYRKADRNVAELLQALLPDPDALMEQGEIVKDGRTIRAARVRIGGKNFFLKRYNPKSFWYRLRNAFRSSRATRVWVNSWGFYYRALPVAEPLICLEQRHGRLLGRSYLLTEYIEDAEPLKHAWPRYDEKQKAALMVRLSLLLAKMHHLGCFHGDLKWSNLLVRGEDVYLVDLDGSKILRRKDLALFRKDIERFLKDMKKYSASAFSESFLEIWRRRIR